MRHEIFLGMLNKGIVMDPRGAGCLSGVMEDSTVEDFVGAMLRVLVWSASCSLLVTTTHFRVPTRPEPDKTQYQPFPWPPWLPPGISGRSS